MAGIVLALVSAFAHAGWNFITKRLADGGLVAMWTYWVSSLLFLALTAPLLLTISDFHVEFSVNLLWAGLISSCLHAFYFAALIRAYRRHDVSIIYPLSRGVAPVIVAVLAALFLQQLPDPLVWTALAVMGVAVWLLSSTPQPSENNATSSGSSTSRPHHRLRQRPSQLWGLALGVSIAAYTTWDAWSIVYREVSPMAYYTVLTFSQSLVVAIWLASTRALNFGFARKHPLSCLTVGMLMPISYISALTATLYIPVALMAALRGTSVMWVTLAAWLFLREQMSTRKVLGVLAALVTITVMAAS